MHPITYCSYALYACIIGIIAYYDLPGEGLAILGILMLADTILGIGKSYVIGGDCAGRFSSHKLKVGVISKMSIIIAAVVTGVAISYLTKNNIVSGLLADIFVGLLISAELISIIQNSIMIHTGEQVEEWDAISAVMTWMLNQIKDIISKFMSH